MRLKKYFVFIIITLFFSINSVSANTVNGNLSVDNNILQLAVSRDNNNYSNYNNYNNNNGEEVNVGCDEIFGSKSDPNSIAYLVNEILLYPKFIVPILLVLYGTLDFFKAVTAGKEDEMKKAQKTFVKRLIIGVAIFLIPAMMNVIMWLADMAWKGLGYTSCGI